MAQQQQVTNGGGGNVASAVTYGSVTPRLRIEAPKADDAIQFYKAAFGAVELERFSQPKRKAEQERPYIGIAKLKFGSSTVLVSDSVDDAGEPLNVAAPSGIVLCFTTEDVEATVAKALQAGAEIVGETTSAGELFCGPDQRFAKVRDPFGFLWIITGSATKEASESEDPATTTTTPTV